MISGFPETVGEQSQPEASAREITMDDPVGYFLT